MNLFEKNRTNKRLSRRELSEQLNIPVYSLAKLESTNWKECSLEIITSVCKKLDIDFFAMMESHFGLSNQNLENGSDEYEYHILSMAHSRLQMLLVFMDEFCRIAKVRKTDYNLTRIGCSLEALNNLSYVTQALQDKKITRKEALTKFPPDVKWEKRKTN
jgi:DNA-binding Xre family transcriptional regulator